jgi:formylmethanofuran dehydrogenase subunit E
MEEHSEDLQVLLGLSAKGHERLCPRQVLGVRMGLLAGKSWVSRCRRRINAFSHSPKSMGAAQGGFL